MNWLAWLVIAAFAYVLTAAGLNLIFPKPVPLWYRGRWALIFEPCDFWVGIYYDRAKRALYVIIIPTLPLRYRRA